MYYRLKNYVWFSVNVKRMTSLEKLTKKAAKNVSILRKFFRKLVTVESFSVVVKLLF